MRRIAILFSMMVISFPLTAGDQIHRPRILGIVSIRILVSNYSASLNFYSKLLTQDQPCLWCGERPRTIFSVNETQFVELANAPAVPTRGRIDEITFATDDVPALRRYLTTRGILVSAPRAMLDTSILAYLSGAEHPTNPTTEPDVYLTALDPEGHRIGFVQLPASVVKSNSSQRQMRLIHAGLIVKDRAVEDHFYKDLLSFGLYWQGGMKDSDTDWVDMHVPDGADWLEYMLNVSPNADRHTLGVMNHFAIGVSDIESATFVAQRSGVQVNEEPKIGRDGKWQLNLYDPDDTRIEFMEFTPTQKPCCSEYTGPHPGPKP
jgi:catechol 2,3-dioxygenase-like lactoylglutathione lyase family enzyme